MGNRFTKNLLSAAVQTILQMAILVLLYRYLVNRVGIDNLGIWSIVLAVVSVARISEIGFGGSIVKYVAAYHSQGNKVATAELLQTAAISVGVLVALFIFIAYPLLRLVLPYVLPDVGLDAAQNILPYCLVSLWLTSIAEIWMNALDAFFHSELRAVAMIFGSVAFFFFAMLGVSRYGLVGLAIAQVIQSAILVSIGWAILRKVLPTLPVIPMQWNYMRFKEMIGYGIRFQTNFVMTLLFIPATKLLIGRLGGLSSAGYFEMAQQIVLKIRAIVVDSNRVIVPVYASMEAIEQDVHNLYRNNTKNLFFFITPVFSVFIAMIPAICEIWIGSLQPQFIVMSSWIAFAWFINIVSSPAYFAYLGKGNLYWVVFSHIAMGGINIIAGIIFGNLFGWKGVLSAFVGALILGSIIPTWAYHYEHCIELRQVFRRSDIISVVVSFSASIIALLGYLAMANASLIDKWQRIEIVGLFICIVSIVIFLLNPLRSKLFSAGSSFLRSYL